MGPDDLPGLGRKAAEALRCAGRRSGRASARSLEDGLRALEALCKGGSLAGTGAGEWLSDNLYVLRRDVSGAARDLRSAKSLRALPGGELLICRATEVLVSACRGKVEEGETEAFLRGFQERCPLEERELGILPAALRRALILELPQFPEEAGAAIPSLLALDEGRPGRMLERLSTLDVILRKDPAGVYPRMDEDSRRDYRSRAASLAEKTGCSEAEAGARVLALAREENCHVGEFLYVRPLGKPRAKQPCGAYLCYHLLLPLLLSLALGLRFASPLAALLVFFPLRDGVKYLFERLYTVCVRPRRLPRLDYSGGIPPESRTLCVSAVLLTGEEEAVQAVRQLERCSLANRDAGSQLCLGLLADLGEGSGETDPRDEAILRAAAAEIERLNARYGGRFCLLTRPRSYSRRDKLWRPRERKRGAVMELTALLCGEPCSLEVRAGDEGSLRDIRYLLVLDGDTMLHAGAAAALAGILAHPLVSPQADPASGLVRRGYAILQPKLAVSLAQAERSEFSRVFAGQGGLDPYGGLNSDVYQDLFGEGSYAGKGMLDVKAFRRVLKGRFPPETLLSHDLLEGAFAGCAYVSDVTFTDGFPAGVFSYFQRQHRWIRGDWQTLPWLLPRVRNARGERVPNPLGPLGKWKILDNLLRSLTPASDFVLLLLCAFFGRRVWFCCLWVALLCMVVRVLAGARRSGPVRRYRSRVLSAGAGELRQLLWLVLLLPYRAWVHGSAVLLALYRSFVSHRNLLAWVTASQGDRHGSGGLALALGRMWFSCLAGAAALLSPWVPFRALGVLWLLSPLLCMAAGRERKPGRPSEEERLFLLHAAGDMLRYFRDQVTEERHWLPPDNLQETPGTVAAERTSPTNIGLYLLSCLAASDLGLWSKEESWRRIEQTLRSLQTLPKFRGHLYNWYDIRSARPLQPAFLSTVDSGNLLACLCVVERAALEDGRETALPLVRELAGPMDLGFLYDEDRRLFRIGWDPETDKAVGGCYDLLESEARITSYLAIARGQVPWKHWRALGRTLADAEGMSGLASWTGTMFEYLLPELLLPGAKGSLLAESREFCVHVQKKRAPGGVWGMSESAFGAVDAGGSYAYKAHGVQGLALKKGMDREAVVAPYASFLALSESRRAAVKNLLRLRALGAEGTYGFVEALDFTPERLEGKPFRPVRCYMAHHLGMSLLAVDDCLCRGIMARRFLSDPDCDAYRELLEERSPVGQRIRPVREEIPASRPERLAVGGQTLYREGFDPLRPAFFPLKGEAYRMVLSQLGGGSAFASLPGRGAEEITVHRGVFFFAASEEGVLSLQPLPELGAPEAFRCSWDGASFCRFRAAGSLEFALRCSPAPAGGEDWHLTVKNRGKTARDLTLVLFLEPVLCPGRDYAAHPAFHRLCLESGMLAGTVTVTRRPGGSAPPCALAAACSQPFTADTDEALVFGRGGLRGLPSALRREGGGVRAASEPCVFLRTGLRLRTGQRKSVRFALGFGSAAGEAAQRAERNLSEEPSPGKAYTKALALLDGRLTPQEALALLTPLLAEPPEKRRRRRGADRAALWRWGISGDLPTAAARGAEGEKLLRAWAFLRTLGVPFDLAILTGDAGVYGQPEAEALRSLAARLGFGGLEGRAGGFHFAAGSEEECRALLASSDAVGLRQTFGPSREGQSLPFYPAGTDTTALRRGSFTPEGYLCSTERGVGRRVWSLMLTNGHLGWLAADSGCGNLWLDNARESRLTPWENDPLRIDGPETLGLVRLGRELSLFSSGDDYPTELLYGFGWIRWRRRMGHTEAETVGFIPPERNMRVLLVTLRDGEEGDRLRWRVRPEEGAVLSYAADALAFSPETGEDGVWQAELEGKGKHCLVLGPEGAAPLSFREGEKLLEETRARWAKAVDAVRLESGEAALDAYLGGWALYQTLACRMLGRASIYQSGGAFGFRDQLQDACALADAFPALTRAHLLLAAAHQYAEGDVMHWWHPGAGGDKGVRTRCSDDLLWLPYAASVYVEKTGDRAVLEEKVPWLVSPVLAGTEGDRYESPETAGGDPLREHCRRALGLAEARGVGPHGLLLFGSGDWNDGMDRVEGESVWLTWFAALVFDRFGALVGEEALRRKARAFADAAEATWSEGQYLRGYFADGRPLGAAWNRECALDSLAQSFAVLSGLGDREHARAAVRKAADTLLDRKLGLVKIFAPPFDGATEPGYIRSYLPGVRENGGQYTHAAIWLAGACLRCGERETGWRLLRALLPAGREEDVYQLEPFVLPADVYAHPQMPGRGGWSWYTGAAGWFLRTAVEELLGVRTSGGRPQVRPDLPRDWDGYRLRYRAGGEDWDIRVRRKEDGWETEVKKIGKA